MKRSISLLALLAVFAFAVPAEPQDGGRGGRRRGPQDGPSMWERIERYDRDGDGRVTREEYTGPARIFDRLDSDRDDVLTREEVLAMGRGGGGRSDQGGRERPEKKPDDAASHDWVFRRLDRDQNGRFDGRDLKAIEKEADENGDGVVDQKEFTEFLVGASKRLPSGRPPEEGEPAPGFTATRLDGKGEISLADLLEKRKPLVLVFGSLT